MIKKYSFNKEDLFKILSVILWSGASAMVATTIAIVEQVEFSEQYVFLVPLINTVLYSLHRFIKS